VTLATRWHAVLDLELDVRCVACRRPLPTLVRGDCVAALFADEELLGVVGECCLAEHSRAELSRLRDLRDRQAPRTAWLREGSAP
jgi:hypothetical protein